MTGGTKRRILVVCSEVSDCGRIERLLGGLRRDYTILPAPSGAGRIV